jgi:DNA-directed RNA polymerase specialized sigma24 family protein
VEFALPMSGPAESQPSLDALLVAELPRLRDFVRRLVGGDDVDDVLQEVAARAWRYRGAFDGERPLAPWLRTTAVRGRAGRSAGRG